MRKERSCASTAITATRCSRRFRSWPKPARLFTRTRNTSTASGYPRGLKGKEIPLGARIFSVADTLDAIISDRPYRPARTLAEARKEIKAWTGRQFDPEVVEVFLKMPDDIFEDLRREINAQSYPFSYSASAKSS